jgi:hypothetical protein
VQPVQVHSQFQREGTRVELRHVDAIRLDSVDRRLRILATTPAPVLGAITLTGK